ncbi:MAG: ATP-binding cassette domain-containing protein [Desulfomonilaceae bacterium]
MEIRVENLNCSFNRGTPLERQALKNISFVVPSGKIVGILGLVGSGKTTLVRTLNGLLKPDSGRIVLGGADISKYGSDLRKKVALVFQHPEKQLFEETVFRDIAFPLINNDDFSEEDVEVLVSKACSRVRLEIDEIRDRSPFELSSGEKRRVALAGALVNDPEILILDEPASDLDPPSLVTLKDFIRSFNNGGSRTVMIVSHEMDCFLSELDLLLVIHEGQEVCFGSIRKVCSELRNHSELRRILPTVGLLVEELRSRNISMPKDTFDLQSIRDSIVQAFRSGRLLN